MGTFLYEELSEKNPFKEEIKKELQSRVTEVLLELGECAIENVNIYGKSIYICDYENLKREDECYVLSYNHFEEDTWEPSYMYADLDKFTGVRSRGIGSKIGYQQHYLAMAVSRVLCECYSEGKYYVHGDIDEKTIYGCLAYIGKKYGFDLVEKFIEYRTNFEIVKNREYCDRFYWGVRGYAFYFNEFLKSDYRDWKDYIEHNFKDDLENAEKGQGFKYCGTIIYIASLFVEYLCKRELEDKLQLDKEQLLEALRVFFQENFIATINIKEWEVYFANNLFNCPNEVLKKYNVSLRNMALLDIARSLADKSLYYKSVKNLLDTAKRNDLDEIMDGFQRIMDELVPIKNDDFNSENKERENAYNIYDFLREERELKNCKQEIMDTILKVMEGSFNIKTLIVSDPFLQELMLYKDADVTMSEELRCYLQEIFSEERSNKYNALARKGHKVADGDNAIKQLVGMIDSLFKESKVLFPTKLFYVLLDASYTKTGRDKIHKIEFYLNDLPESNQKKVFLWFLHDKNLCKKCDFLKVF